MKEFDLEALSEFTGKDGRPAYVVREGKVYDVSDSKLWKNGLHMGRHHAGTDLTTDFRAAPHGPEVLERVPQIGTVKKREEPKQFIPDFLSRLFRRIPMLKRHPHPMTVHFPIVFMFTVPTFDLLYLFTGYGPFETTALHCLAAGVLFIPVAMLTGLLSWWVNYMAKPLKAVLIKVSFSAILWILSVIILSWRLAVPDLLTSPGTSRFAALMIILSLLPLVIVIGWHGAKLTFPIEKE